MKLKIRPETPADFDAVYELIETAFKTAKVKDGSEQDFAAGLRTGNGYIPELALVAENAGRLIGHIMLTETFVLQPDGSEFRLLLAAPLSVVLEERDKGVGSALMEEGLERAVRLGYKAAILVGDPEYYRRFGFVRASDYGIRPEGDIPGQFVLIKALDDVALAGVSGVCDCC